MSNLRRFTHATWLIGVAAMFVAGCGDDDDDSPLSPTDQCNEVVKVECRRIFECTTDLERQGAGLPPGLTELNCIIGGAVQIGCAMATEEKICAGSQSYSADKAKACIAEASKADCATIKANYPNVAPYAPSCGQCVPM
jgi:hypothetical protein